jgi:hypothetical protein
VPGGAWGPNAGGSGGTRRPGGGSATCSAAALVLVRPEVAVEVSFLGRAAAYATLPTVA